MYSSPVHAEMLTWSEFVFSSAWGESSLLLHLWSYSRECDGIVEITISRSTTISTTVCIRLDECEHRAIDNVVQAGVSLSIHIWTELEELITHLKSSSSSSILWCSPLIESGLTWACSATPSSHTLHYRKKKNTELSRWVFMKFDGDRQHHKLTSSSMYSLSLGISGLQRGLCSK